MLRSSLQLWQSWSCAKVVIVRQLDQNERPGTDNTKQTQTNPKTTTPTPSQQPKGFWPIEEKVKRGETTNALTTSEQKKPRLSQYLQHLVVNDVNAQTLIQWALSLAVSIDFYQRIPHSFIKARAKKHLGSLACHCSWAHQFIIQKKQKCLNRYELSKHSGFQAWIGVWPARCTPMLSVRTPLAQGRLAWFTKFDVGISRGFDLFTFDRLFRCCAHWTYLNCLHASVDYFSDLSYRGVAAWSFCWFYSFVVYKLDWSLCFSRFPLSQQVGWFAFWVILTRWVLVWKRNKLLLMLWVWIVRNHRKTVLCHTPSEAGTDAGIFISSQDRLAELFTSELGSTIAVFPNTSFVKRLCKQSLHEKFSVELVFAVNSYSDPCMLALDIMNKFRTEIGFVFQSYLSYWLASWYLQAETSFHCLFSYCDEWAGWILRSSVGVQVWWKIWNLTAQNHCRNTWYQRTPQRKRRTS